MLGKKAESAIQAGGEPMLVPPPGTAGDLFEGMKPVLDIDGQAVYQACATWRHRTPSRPVPTGAQISQAQAIHTAVPATNARRGMFMPLSWRQGGRIGRIVQH